MANNTSQHILSSSATLLGFCLFVITSVHINSTSETHNIDEITSIVGVLLTFSCISSFLSIRTVDNPSREKKLESIADLFFIMALLGILIIILLITLNYIY